MSVYATVWADLDSDPLPAGIVIRRVLPALQHDCHLGMRKPTGELFMELHLVGPVGSVPPQDPSTRGLEVAVVLKAKDDAVIRVRLKSTAMAQQFYDVVEDILAGLATQPGDGATARVVERLLAWREFFAGDREPMSPDEAAGLFAELTLLHDFILPALDPADAVRAWTGPDPARQDFQFNLGALEVKSWRGHGAARVRISSEEQLDTASIGPLWVVLVELDQRKAGLGSTLKGLIETCRAVLEDDPATALAFEDKLLAAKWRDELAQVRNEVYSVLKTEFFFVGDEFPRLVPASLPVGVGDVTYCVDRSALEPFLSQPEIALSALGVPHG